MHTRSRIFCRWTLVAALHAGLGAWIIWAPPPHVQGGTVGPTVAQGRGFWSFQPLKSADPPAVKDPAWCRTPIDRFILAKLQEKGIAPTRPADRRTLIRRVYFDLLGLPPTPGEIDAFVHDDHPDAYEKLIDKLLASPHYGERWGRRWLDLARFAESHGFEHDYDRASAYPYRDFVIKALNDDLPYDTFVKWQLAGDEIEPENRLALAATGFLGAGVHSTQITKNEVEKQRYDELDDIVSTTGTAFLGMTIGCARCHDHKFDPIPTRDYYRMVSVFTTTVRSEITLDEDKAGYDKAKQAFDREHAPLASAVERFEREQIPGRFDRWLAAGGVARTMAARHWVVLPPTKATAESPAKLVDQGDGSVLATGIVPETDVYTIVARTTLKNIGSIRIEALTDPSLPKNGPGRAGNGNFCLTNLQVWASSPDTSAAGGVSKSNELKLRNARATFEQTKPSLPVAAAIDGDKSTGWAVDPQVGRTQAASFDLDAPVAGYDGGTTFTFRLEFRNNKGHAIGRPRISIAPVISNAAGDAPQPALNAPGVAEIAAEALTALARPGDEKPAEISAPQHAALLAWYAAQDPDWQRLNDAVQSHLARAPHLKRTKMMICTEGLPAIRLHTQGDDFQKETYFLKRGNPSMKDGVAPPGYLQVLEAVNDPDQHWAQTPPPGSRTSYRRRGLAQWMTDTKGGAGDLLARVIVNRVWQGHMGRGIVATPSDFGTRGEAPTHPELLDWLATELVKNGWRLKPIHRLILTSNVYLQGPDVDEAKQKLDPDNRLCWRHPRQRLEAEIIRDNMLSVAGMLDEQMFGPGTLDESMRRRSIYFTVKRSHLIPMLQVFDWPDALAGVGDRQATTVAPQALLLMNNPQVRAYAAGLAKRTAPDAATTDEDAVAKGYEIALGRSPTDDERADAVKFLEEQRKSYQATGKTVARELALTDFCQSLFCLNEFVYVD